MNRLSLPVEACRGICSTTLTLIAGFESPWRPSDETSAADTAETSGDPMTSTSAPPAVCRT